MSSPDRRLPGELTFLLALLLFALTALWQSYRISGFASWSSPGALPMLASLVMVAAALQVLLGAARQASPDIPAGGSLFTEFARALLPRVIVGFAVLIVVYMFALEPLGFVVSSFLFLVAGMWLLGSRRVVYNVVVSAASLAAVYVVFQTAFSVVLPAGLLRGILP
jgi:putative tricarboxylic transport membrane protein